MTDARNRLIYGTDEPPQPETRLTAGPLSALFVGGALRDIRIGGVEVIRGLYFLVRDRNWATMVPAVQDLNVESDGASFAVTFTCRGRTPSDNQPFVWKGSIRGSLDSGIVFDAEGESDREFLTCRTGFIVLHPLERTVGFPVEIEHGDGSREQGAFPDLVDPMQSFLDVVRLTHEALPGLRVTCRMTGGTWETEDHRNWMDASFKTYFRALTLPWPYTLAAGETVRQQVAVTFTGDLAQLKSGATEAPIGVVVGDRSGGTLPDVGVGLDEQETGSALGVAPAVAALGCQHVALRVHTDSPNLAAAVRRTAALARTTGGRVHLEIVVADRVRPEQELDLVAIAAAGAGLRPASILVMPAADLLSYPPSVARPPAPPLVDLCETARRLFPGIPVGGGVVSFFPELNRHRPPAEAIDFVQHGTTSVVHAADDRSVMETLQSLPHIFRSTRAFAPGLPYRISRAGIGMPFNPYGASTAPNPDNLRRTTVAIDPRERGLFGAAFAAGYFIRAAQGGLAAVTMMAATGPQGVIDEHGPRPVAAAIALFAVLAGGAVLQTTSSDPQRLLALAAETAGRRTLILVNLTADSLAVNISGFDGARAGILDEDSRSVFAPRGDVAGELRLLPYAVAKLEA